MRHLHCIVLGLAWAFAVVSISHAVTINFDSLPNGTIVTNQFPEVTFSSDAGFVNQVFNFSAAFGGSAPNAICTAGFPLICANSTILDFTNPVSNLSFLALAVDDVGMIATVDVFQGGVLSATVSIIGQGHPPTGYVPLLVDLTAFSNVTRIVIRNLTDSGGITWDDFTFSVQASPEVVEVDIDIKPGPTTLNCIQKTNNGVLPVTIFGDAVDVHTIDIASLQIDDDSDPTQ